MWWTYFTRFAATAQERLSVVRDPVLAAADGYSYLHLLLVAGIIVFAVGARDTVSQAAGALSDPARLALCGGVAVYLLGGVAFRLRMVGSVGWVKLATVAACMVLYLLSSSAAAWVPAAGLVVLLALLLSWEHVHDPVAPADA
jgi:low temperature requirement protein LtrA